MNERKIQKESVQKLLWLQLVQSAALCCTCAAGQVHTTQTDCWATVSLIVRARHQQQRRGRRSRTREAKKAYSHFLQSQLLIHAPIRDWQIVRGAREGRYNSCNRTKPVQYCLFCQMKHCLPACPHSAQCIDKKCIF